MINRESLLTLEAYSRARTQMRAEVIEHKKRRLVQLGNHVSLLFEDEKTSAVHFVRFELTPEMKSALKGGAQMMVGCDHPNYPAHVEELPQETLAALLADLHS